MHLRGGGGTRASQRDKLRPERCQQVERAGLTGSLGGVKGPRHHNGRENGIFRELWLLYLRENSSGKVSGWFGIPKTTQACRNLGVFFLSWKTALFGVQFGH